MPTIWKTPFNRSFNYGPTTSDRRHIFVTTYTWRLPLFRRMQGLGGNLLKGREVSGIVRFQSRQYLTPNGATSIGGRRADYVSGDIAGPQTITE